MRQWFGALALLFIIGAIAAFVVVSTLSIADASFRFQMAFDGADDSLYSSSLRPCDPLAIIPCD